MSESKKKKKGFKKIIFLTYWLKSAYQMEFSEMNQNELKFKTK